MKKLYSKAKRLVLLFVWLACSHAVLAQERVVTGTVKDENGGTMPGVNVLVSGTSNGTVTDASGKFSISVGSGARLSFSFIGYTSQEVAVGSSTTLNVSMKTDVTELVEVVVTGYASQQKRDITGSVAVVDIKDMTKIASSNFGDQLQGKVAGVQVGTSGDPGSSQMVRIRGVGTINNNEPLYVIDGVPVQSEANMNFLNPNDIESMQVLKDAASASIYGSRAANGVVVITTKKGKAGNSKLNIDYFMGSASMGPKTPGIANPAELLEINKQLAAGAGSAFASNFYVNQGGGNFALPDFFTRTGGYATGATQVDPAKYYLNPDPNGDASVNYLIAKANKEGTDWFKEVFKPATQQSFQLSASGGSDKGNYFFSANYYDHNGILIENYYKRYQVRMNSTYNIKEKIRVGQTLNIAYQTTQGSVGNPNEGSAIKNAYAMPQIVPVYDINGYFAGPAALPSNASNPVAQQTRAAANKGNHSFRVTGNVFAEVDILKNFTAKTSFGLDYGVGFNQFYGFRNFDATEVNSSNRLDQSAYNNRNWVWFNTLAYNKEFGDHKVTGLIGSEAKHIFYEGLNGGGAKLTFGDDPYYRLLGNTDSKSYTIGSYKGENKTFSVFAQGNYSFADKYLVSATIRRDGSSRFLNNQYGIFPAASLGWRLTKESFMANMDAINELKLRVSYGVLGNNEAGDYPGFNNYGTSPGLASYDINGTGNSVVPGFEQTSTGNPNLRWESTKLFNIGLDATLIDNLDLTVEYFDRKTEDMIYGVTLPFTGGQVGFLQQNIGTMQNRGLEMALTYRGKAMGGDLSYSIGLNGTTIKNEVLNLDANSNSFVRSGGSRIGDITYTKAGLPISQYYGFIADGLWTNQSEINTTLFEAVGDAKVGRIKFRDLNSDGQINSDDETFIGSPLPKLLLGLNLNASYKGFDFTLFLNGSYGQKLYNFMKYFIDFPAFQGNYSKDMLYEAGKSLPVLDRNDNYSPQRSSIYVEDGSWTRLRNLQVGYTLPTSTLTKVGFDKVRVYLQGQNLFTITKYSGLDPDVTISNITEGFAGRRDLSLGVDYGRYPWARTIILGVNLGL